MKRMIWTFLALMICTVACQKSKQQAIVATSQTAAPAPTPTPAIVFGTEQNDEAGHSGMAWGASRDTLKLRDADYSSGGCSDSDAAIIAKLAGAPVSFPSQENLNMAYQLNGMGIGAQAPEFHPALPDFVSLESSNGGSGGECLGFVDGKFAFAVTYLGTAEKDQGRAFEQLKQKYQIAGTVGENEWGNQAPLPNWLLGFVPRLKGTIFRRGSTNTRVYYLEESYSSSEPDPLLYIFVIPNSNLDAIQRRWQEQAEDARIEAATEEEKQKHVDAQQQDKKVQQAIQ